MKMLYAAVAAVALSPVAALANGNTASGSSDGLSWEASSNIVGQRSTGTVASGGNPIHLAPHQPVAPSTFSYSGVVGLLMTYNINNQVSQFVCSGSLLTNGQILTAAHCVSNGAWKTSNGVAAGLVQTQVLFQNSASNLADENIYGFPAGVTAIDVASYNIHGGYTGAVIDQNDIALLTLSQAAPAFAQAYEIYNQGDLTGDQFNVTGFGTRSSAGGQQGTDGGFGLGPSRLRQGDNLYDYRLGDAAFAGFFTDARPNGNQFFGSKASIEYSYISDFDRTIDPVTGLPAVSPANSQACRLAAALVAGGTAGATALGFCTNGVGLNEVGIAGGDSGGAAFINGQIASVNSYSLTFGTGFGDYKTGLQSSWGELNGFVPTFIHADFIAGIPEPGTWAMMILGFGFVGGVLRRRGQGQFKLA
jgi:hypothetical protein